MSNYSIQSGDTLAKIVKNKYHLSKMSDIQAKINQIAKENNISNINCIKAGTDIDLPESRSNSVFGNKKQSSITTPTFSHSKFSKNVGEKISNKATADTTKTQATKSEDKKESNTFDNWSVNNQAQNQKDWDSASKKDLKYQEEHSDDATGQMENQEKLAKEVEKKTTELPKFSFRTMQFSKAITTDEGKNASQVYADDVVKLSEESIKNAPQLDKDNSTMNLEEYTQKEVANYQKFAKKSNSENVKTDEKTLKETKEAATNAFKTIDLNGDGKIDAKEQSAVYAAMDQNDAGYLNEKIDYAGYTDTTNQLSNPNQQSYMKSRLTNLYSTLFGQQEQE